MVNANDEMIEKAAATMSGWCAGCGARLEREAHKTIGLYVPDDGSGRGLYLMCDPCHNAVVTESEGYEKLLERVEQRVAAYAVIGDTKGNA